MERKIIGYLCPTNLFNGEALKGTMFVKTKWNNDFYGWGENANTTSYSRHLPKEIVEQWEACYEEEYKAGDWVVGWYCELKEGYHKNAWQIDRITGDYAYVKGTNHNTRES